jgi:hypothetical protein
MLDLNQEVDFVVIDEPMLAEVGGGSDVNTH